MRTRSLWELTWRIPGAGGTREVFGYYESELAAQATARRAMLTGWQVREVLDTIDDETDD